MTITLSDSALTKLQTLYDPSKYRGLRVAVKGAGCSGMQYVLEWSIHKNLEDLESVYEGIPYTLRCKVSRLCRWCNVRLAGERSE